MTPRQQIDVIDSRYADENNNGIEPSERDMEVRFIDITNACIGIIPLVLQRPI